MHSVSLITIEKKYLTLLDSVHGYLHSTENSFRYSGLQKELEQFQITNILCFSDPLEALF
jgi:hypothetical protein